MSIGALEGDPSPAKGFFQGPGASRALHAFHAASAMPCFIVAILPSRVFDPAFLRYAMFPMRVGIDGKPILSAGVCGLRVLSLLANPYGTEH
jgi:hypothetical protein